MNRAELTVQRTALRKLLEPLEAIVMCCESFAHFQGGWCCEHEAERPRDVVMNDIGCESWEHDGVPF